MNPKPVALLALVAFLHITSGAQSQQDNAVLAQLQKNVADILAGFQQFSSDVEERLAIVHTKVTSLERSSKQVERKLSMLVERVAAMNGSQQDSQLRSIVAQLAGSVLSNTKSAYEGRINLNHLQDQMEDVNATVQTNMEDIATFNERLNARKDNIQRRQTSEECSLCDEQLATQIRELGGNLTDKMDMMEAQTNSYSSVCIQFLPTSCQEIAKKRPDSTSGHYQILAENGTVETLYCYFTSSSNPAPSCDAIMTTSRAPAGEYWVTVENGSSQIIFCPSDNQPAASCAHLFDDYPLTPAGVYWVGMLRAEKKFCTTFAHPASSCQAIFDSNPTTPTDDYWVIIDGESLCIRCLYTSESERQPSCKHIFNINPTIPSGRYWIAEGQAYCTSEYHPAASCEVILDVGNLLTDRSGPFGPHWIRNGSTAKREVCTSEVHKYPRTCEELPNFVEAGLYWIKGKDSQVYCTSRTNPASSIRSVLNHFPALSSGYYWAETQTDSPQRVYCTPKTQCCNSTGGWMRVAYLNMTNTTQQCPQGFRLRTDHNKRTCGRVTGTGCTSISYSTHGLQYNKVCGKVIAYQYHSPNAFEGGGRLIDSHYVDGVSITHGYSPRRHIWTFAAALDETIATSWSCPCTKTNAVYTGRVPSFVGNDYFCETSSRTFYQSRFYHEDPLWDGEGCGPNSSCCTFNSPPWFCKQLPQPTTDNIEVRVCSNQGVGNEDTPLELIEVYIQ